MNNQTSRWVGLGIISPRGLFLEAIGERSDHILKLLAVRPRGSQLVVVRADLQKTTPADYRRMTRTQFGLIEKGGAQMQDVSAKVRRRRQPANQARMVTRWNEQHPIGTRVRYYSLVDKHGEPQGDFFETRTWTVAQMLGRMAVVWLEGKAGYVSLKHCRPVEP